MNIHKFKSLPLSLLFSTIVYAMDPVDTEQLFPVNNEIIVEVTSTLTLPMPENLTKNHTINPINVSSCNSTAKSESLGASKWFSDSMWGEDKNVVFEIKNNKFNANNTANERRLERTIEKYTKSPTIANLNSLHDLMTTCEKKELLIDSTKVLVIARKFVAEYRVTEEKHIVEKTNSTLKNSRETRVAILNKLREQVNQAIEALRVNDEAPTHAINDIFSVHQPVILKSVEIERATKEVNSNLKPDCFTTNPTHSYDSDFLKDHLTLSPLIQAEKEANNLLSENIINIKSMLELADKKSLTVQRKQHSSNE